MESLLKRKKSFDNGEEVRQNSGWVKIRLAVISILASFKF